MTHLPLIESKRLRFKVIDEDDERFSVLYDNSKFLRFSSQIGINRHMTVQA